MEHSISDTDLDLLFKLRLLVARYGEMDVAKWWNTNGILGPMAPWQYPVGSPKLIISPRRASHLLWLGSAVRRSLILPRV